MSPESDMKILCDRVRAILVEESNSQPISSPVTICGDIHDQFWDLLELLRKGGQVPETSYILWHPIVVSVLKKFRYPDKVALLRGNHENERQQKYGSAAVWKARCSVFDFLDLAATERLCVHGGLLPDIRTLDQIRVLSRAQEIPHEGAFCAVSPRGAGWLFGRTVTREVLNSSNLIAGAHQLVQEGYKYMFDDQLVTVWYFWRKFGVSGFNLVLVM
ncbi:Metallo-dependent phosphatase [Suillus weaverae]|nr:Metallo-dependent phosphatase [Suillus weaverae]